MSVSVCVSVSVSVHARKIAVLRLVVEYAELGVSVKQHRLAPGGG